ncbi:1-acyl-sn-glycerol-3-phosphate acyltransferase [Myxococcota bacterium]|nr:1-acyl-sn-glycerol-3-phosphate acyltransferase [Myxococcota bacterium]
MSPSPAALEARRDRLALLYLPWALGVFLPVVGSSMLFCGTLAVLLSTVSANAGWWVGVLWSRLVCLVNFTRVELQGAEHVQPGQGYVYLLNHQSHFDVAAFYGTWRHQFRWVVKEELRKVPGLGWYCQVGGHVFVDRKDHARAVQSLERARQRLQREKMSIAFFPEGTRSVDGRLQPFKKGGFVMARQLGLPILPVSVSGSHAVLPGKRLRLLPGRIVITVHPPIPTDGLTEADQPVLMERVREAIASGLTPWERGEEG